MTRDEVIRLARESGFAYSWSEAAGEALERFAELVAAAEREKVAQWMIRNGYATGHGDTVEDLLHEIEWQVAERAIRARGMK